jgi:hypothetical protein
MLSLSAELTAFKLDLVHSLAGHKMRKKWRQRLRELDAERDNPGAAHGNPQHWRDRARAAAGTSG